MNSDTKPGVKDTVNNLRHGLIGVAVFSTLVNLLLFTGPLFMLQVYDRVLTSQSLQTLVALAAIALFLYVAYGFFDILRALLLSRLSRGVDTILSTVAFSETFALRPRTGGTKLTAINHLNSVRAFTGSPVAAALFDLPWIPIYLGVVFLLHPMLGLLAIGGAVLLVILSLANAFVAHALTKNQVGPAQNDNHYLTESARQTETIHAMGMLSDVRDAWQSLRLFDLDGTQTLTRCNAVFAAAARTVRLALQSGIIGVGAYLVIANELSAGALIAASIIFGRALAPLDQCIANWRTIKHAFTAYTSLRELEIEASDVRATDILPLPKNNVDVEALSVGAPNSVTSTLEGFSFSLESGDALALVAESGGGKTTLLRGLLGAWPATEGEIRFDGATLDQWTEAKRRRIIGYAPQDAQLLPGTIADNIARFADDAEPEEITAAAQRADAHDLIVRLPQGYDTMVGAGGYSLSGGQTQRIVLARAVFRMPFMVLLDEPNANLDARGERALAALIQALRDNGSIVVMATHRGVLTNNLNKVLVISNGRQSAFGDTAEVFKRLSELREAKAKTRGELVAV